MRHRRHGRELPDRRRRFGLILTDAATHELLIVGAGPAGASAAMAARRAGLRVALIDKAAFPRNKLCGGGVTGRAMGHLHDVFGALPDELFLKVNRFRFVTGAVALCEFDDAPDIWMTMRHSFDAVLRARALEAGAEDFCGQRIASMAPREGRITLVSGQTLQAPVVIAADGVNSAVAHAMYGRAYDPARIGFALEAEIAGPPGVVTELDMTAAPWGYGWDFPKAGGRTLGLGGIAVRNADMKLRFERWLAARGIDPAGVKIKGHHLPFGELRTHPGDGRVLFAGDAAGLVDPITGEGIAWAVRSGQLAAEAAALALTMDAPDRVAALYSARMRHVQRELRRAGLLSKLVYHPRLQPRFMRALSRSDHLQRRFLSLLAGEMDYADLGPARMMSLAWRILRGRSQ